MEHPAPMQIDTSKNYSAIFDTSMGKFTVRSLPTSRPRR